MLRIAILASTVALAAGVAAAARAELISPQVGWQADLSTYYHNVSGTVTILDDDTVQVDDFTYDGGGPFVYFYLGASQSSSDFGSGLQIGSQLAHTPYDGTQGPMVLQLPSGQTLEGYHAISVWCVEFHVDFGSGTFGPVELLGDYNGNGTIDAADYTVWRDALAAGSPSLLNDATPAAVDESDYTYWRAHFGESAGSGATGGGRLAIAAVPEPASALLLLLAGFGLAWLGRGGI